MSQTQERCGFCGYELRTIWVHGHGQCATCGINVHPCCDGAQVCPAPEPAPTERKASGAHTSGKR